MATVTDQKSGLLPRVLLSVVALLLTLLAVEGALRLGGWNGQISLSASLNEIPPELYRPDRRLIRRHVPGVSVEYTTVESHATLRTNALGLRGPEQNPQQRGVLCLGDSFTFGAQVSEEETSCMVLARELDARRGEPWQAMNAGVAAYGTWQALGVFQELAPQLRPSAVVLNLYYGNDIVDNARFKNQTQQAAPGFVGEDPAVARARRARNTQLARSSHLIALALAARAQWSPDPGMTAMLQEELLPFSSEASLREMLPSTTTALRAFGKECQRLRVPCVVSLIPPAWVVYPERASATAALAGTSVDALDAGRVVASIQAAVPEGVHVQDLTPMLQAESDNALLYYRFDPHWTPAGHQLAAEAQALLLEKSSLATRER